MPDSNPAPYANAVPSKNSPPLTPLITRYFAAASRLAARVLPHAAMTYRQTVAHSSATNDNIRLRERTNIDIAAAQTIITARNSHLRPAPFAKYPKPSNAESSAQTVMK